MRSSPDRDLDETTLRAASAMGQGRQDDRAQARLGEDKLHPTVRGDCMMDDHFSGPRPPTPTAPQMREMRE